MHLKKIFISSDHAGFNLKKSIIQKFYKKQKIVDLGPSSDKSVDYPDYHANYRKKYHLIMEVLVYLFVDLEQVWQ